MNEESLSLIHITNPVNLFSNELDKEIINGFGIRIANFKPHLNDCKDLVIHTLYQQYGLRESLELKKIIKCKR